MGSIPQISKEIAALTMSQLTGIVNSSGLCSGTPDDDRWHPDVEPKTDHGRAEYEANARKACVGCPAKAACLLLALRTESRPKVKSHGVWGGTAPWERERMLRRIKRRADAAAARRTAMQVEGVPA